MRVAKDVLKTTMLGLEADQLQASREAYSTYLENARLDRTESLDSQDLSQAVQSGRYAEAFDAPIHNHERAIEQIEALDFGTVDVVGPGAVVLWNGQNFVIVALTQEFECQGQTFMGISCDAPITAALLGKSAGDAFEVNGISQVIDDVY